MTASSIGFGYGVTQRWFTELYRKYEGSTGEGTHFDAWEWENKFQLTETGQYPVDVGFIVELERPKNRNEGNEVRFGPLFQTEFAKPVGQPLASSAFAKWGRSNARKFQLPLRELRFLGAKPGKGGTNFSQRAEVGHFLLHARKQLRYFGL